MQSACQQIDDDCNQDARQAGHPEYLRSESQAPSQPAPAVTGRRHHRSRGRGGGLRQRRYSSYECTPATGRPGLRRAASRCCAELAASHLQAARRRRRRRRLSTECQVSASPGLMSELRGTVDRATDAAHSPHSQMTASIFPRTARLDQKPFFTACSRTSMAVWWVPCTAVALRTSRPTSRRSNIL